MDSTSAGNPWRLSAPQVDAWAEQQQTELDPDARKEIHKTMWDYFLQKMFWPPVPSGLGLQIYQPWLHGIRFGGIFGANSSYYDWGDQVAGAWIDPDIDGRAWYRRYQATISSGNASAGAETNEGPQVRPSCCPRRGIPIARRVVRYAPPERRPCGRTAV